MHIQDKNKFNPTSEIREISDNQTNLTVTISRWTKMYEKLEDTKGVIRNHKSKDKTIKWQKKKDKQ